MTFSKREKLILASIAILIILIPSTSFVIAYRFRAQTQTNASNGTVSNFPVTNEASGSALEQLQKNLGVNSDGSSSTSSNSTDTSGGAQLSFGPTVSFKINIPERPLGNMAAKVFLGIASGELINKPSYLLSFKVDVPANGTFSNLSLAGLSQGTTYTAYIKGPAQIATSSAFSVKPTNIDLGTVNLISGDLNEDNVIDQNDFDIVKGLYGTIPSSSNWNVNADFNGDNIINNWDMAVVTKNIGKIGAGGAWYSKVSQLDTPTPDQTPVGSASGKLLETPNTGSPATPSPSSGYWLWVPNSY